MRLIDADAFLDKLKHIPMVQDAIRKAMDGMPPVDAVPVVHGQWFIGDDGSLHCSKCSTVPISRISVHGIQIFDMTPVKEMMKYCPNCGAKMDKEDSDNE